jgi:predicted CopG family antitoxin
MCNMHIAQVSTKTISLKKEAYDRLRAARRYPGESFSEVVLRATWPEDTITARGLLELRRRGPRLFTDRELDEIEALKKHDAPPGDKWARR